MARLPNLIEELKTHGDLKRARRAAFILGTFLIIALVSIVYALVQQTEAKRQEKIVSQLQEEVLNLRMQVVQAQKEAEHQRMIANKSAEEAFAQKLAVDVVNNQLQVALKELNRQKSKKD